MAQLLYGAGLGLLAGMTLRVRDFDFDRRTIVVRSGKSNQDRVTLLTRFCRKSLQTHLVYRLTG